MAGVITIEVGLFSADRDHTQFTGGTTKELKQISSPEGISLYHYLLPASDTHGIAHIDKAIHTAEHMLAYAEDTGSLRSQLEQVSGETDLGKCVIDLSPFRVNENTLGFRASSVVPLDTAMLTEAYARSVAKGLSYIVKGGQPPFATPRQCGQYDLHSTSAAHELLSSAQQALRRGVTALDISVPRPMVPTITVADLRLVRPKAADAHTQRTLRPDASYVISQLIEQYADAEGRLAIGTYGCMTGAYLMMTDLPQDIAHIAVTRTLMRLAQLRNSRNETVRRVSDDAAFCLDHIQEHSPFIYQQAMDLGRLPFDAEEALSNAGNLRRKPVTN